MFNTTGKGRGEQQARGGGREPLQCWICRKDHRKRIVRSIRVVVEPIYNTQEANTVGDVGHNIPCIYADVDNMQEDHQASIIEMDGKLCDQVVSILIDLVSNYSYINLDLMDKCGLRK